MSKVFLYLYPIKEFASVFVPYVGIDDNKMTDSEKMNKDDPNQVFAISELARERIDYPDYAVFMQRDLGKKSSDKWYDRIKHLK